MVGTPSSGRPSTPSRTARRTTKVSSTADSLPRMPSLASIQGYTTGTSSAPTAKNKKGKTPQQKRWKAKGSQDPSTAGSSSEDEEAEEAMEHNHLLHSMMTSPSTGDLLPPPSSPARARPLPTSNSMSRSRSATTSVAVGSEKQNIRVAVRIRPSAQDAEENDNPIWTLDVPNGRITLSDNHPIMEKRKTVSSEDMYGYRFDQLLVAPEPTSTLYDATISPIIQSCMDGFNSTVFSYGQTGSGKTHTMMGNDDEPGIIPQAVQEIFAFISKSHDREYLLRISYLEIYNETLRDLLAPGGGVSKELKLHEDKKGRVVVANLKEEIVSSPLDIFNCLQKGEDNRSVAGTDWNLRSSRSHCVFSMIIESRPRSSVFSASDSEEPALSPSSSSTELPYASTSSSTGEVRISQLNLIDLAGSERATSQEERRKEGAFINKSLLFLGTVIQKLAEGKAAGGKGGEHIPYRDSKLTRLLQTSLSGNARIAIVCTVSPEARHGIESVSTLKFAQRASKVITKAERGVLSTNESGALIAKYEAQLAELRAQFERNQSLSNLNAASSTGIDEEVLEGERIRRQKAESEAEDYRLENIRLREQIGHLSGRVLTSSSTTNSLLHGTGGMLPLPGTPLDLTLGDGFDEDGDGNREYGELGVAGRPAGPRARRRISGRAFGIGVPHPSHLQRLKGHGGSWRSFSSNLETVKSPSMAALDKVAELESELSALRAERESQADSSSTVQDLQTRISTLESELVHVHSRMKAAVSEKDSYIQEAGDQASQIMKLQRELEEALKRSSTATALEESGREEVEGMRKRLQEREEGYAEMKENLQVALGRAEKLREQLKQREEIGELKRGERELSLEKEVAKLQSQLAERREASRQDEQASSAKLVAAEDQLRQSEEKLLAQQRQADSEKSTLQAQLAAKDEELQSRSRKQAEVAASEREKLQRELVNEKERYESRNSVLEAKLAEAQQTIETLGRNKVEVEGQATARERELSARHTELQREMEAQQQARDAARIANEARLVESERTIAALTRQLASTKATSDELLASERKRAGELALALETANTEKASMRAELEKKEQIKKASDALKAANTPTLSGLQAKIDAAKNYKSSLTSSTPASARYANRSLGASTSSDAGENEEKLRAELETVKKEANSGKLLIESQKTIIVELQQDIAQWRQRVLTQGKMLEELSNGGQEAELYVARQLQSIAIADDTETARRWTPSAKSNTTPTASPSRTRQPFSHMSHYKSHSVNLPSRPSTPTRKDHSYNSLTSSPRPLPTPPEWGMSDLLRKKRRVTIENELEKLRDGQKIEKSRTALMSPKLEKEEPKLHHHVAARGRTLSNVSELENFGKRATSNASSQASDGWRRKKGSAESSDGSSGY